MENGQITSQHDSEEALFTFPEVILVSATASAETIFPCIGMEDI